MARTTRLPEHVETTVDAVAGLDEEHARGTSGYQRTIGAVTDRFGTPYFLGAITITVVLWIGTNVTLIGLHRHPFDPPPFFWLQGSISTAALFVAVLILTRQRHETILAERRAQLTLQIALVSERKLAKVLERLEHYRRDDPGIEDRHDPEADEMSSPVDPQQIATAIRAAAEPPER